MATLDLPTHVSGRNPPSRWSPYRRRRIIWGTLLAFGLILFFAPESFWEHSRATTIRDFGGSLIPGVVKPNLQKPKGLSKPPIVPVDASRGMEKQEGKAKGKGEQENTKTSQTSSPPPELVQFLHMVASSELRIPSDVDPSHPLDPSVYAVGGGPRAASFKPEDPDPPVIVFSKTYCQFSTKAKKLLKSYDLSPPPKIIEVDLRDDSEHIKTLLTRLSHHSTFPNIFVQGVSLGGSDDLQRLHLSGELMTVLTNAGVDVQSEIADGLGPA